MASILENIIIKIREDGARQVARNFKAVGDAADKADDSVGMFGKVLGGLALGATLLSLARVADQFTNLQNRLRLVTTGSANLARVTKELGEIANATRSDFSATADMYARMANASKELGLSQQDTLDFTKSLNQAVILSGASAEEAAGGLRQLSQGLSKGVLNGDELTGVLEGLPAVADVIAKGFGVTRGQLKQMGEDGKLSATGIIDAFKKAKDELENNFGTTVPTIAQSFTVLKNNFTLFLGELDKSLGITSTFAGLILGVANNLNILLPILAGVGVAMGVAFSASLLASFGAQLKVLWAVVLANPFVALAAAVAGVVTAIYLLRDQIKLGVDDTTTLGDLMRAAWETIGPMITEVGRIAKDVFGFITEELGKSVTLWTGITFKGTSDQEDSWFGLLRSVVRTFDAIGATVRGVMLAVGRTIAFVVNESINRFKQLGDVAYKSLTGDFAGAIAAAGQMGTDSAGAFGKIGDIWASTLSESFGAQMKGGLESGLDGWVKRAKEIGADRLKDAKDAALGGGGPAVKPPAAVDKDAAKKAADAMKQFKDALSGVLDRAFPVIAAEKDLAAQHDILAKAVKMGLISQELMNGAMEELTFQMQAQLDPLKALNKEIDDNIKLLGMSAEQRQIEGDLTQTVNRLRQDGVLLTKTETDALRAKLVVEQELAKIASSRDSYDSSSMKGQLAAFATDIKGFQASLAGGGSGAGDVAGMVSGLLPWANLEGSQEQMTAYVEQHKMMYEQIKALSDANIINHQTAASLMAQADIVYMENRLQGVRSMFGALAGLSSSGNRKLAAIGKAAAVADAVISGILATQKALAAPPGPPYTIPMAAITAGMAAVNVAKIVSTPLPGFRTGGEFRIGGSGGEDSQTVAFRGSPNETVSIKTPQQLREEAKQMTGDTVIRKTEVHVHVPQSTDYRSASQIGQYAAEGVNSGSRND